MRVDGLTHLLLSIAMGCSLALWQGVLREPSAHVIPAIWRDFQVFSQDLLHRHTHWLLLSFLSHAATSHLLLAVRKTCRYRNSEKIHFPK
jgi:hypothetical protein